MIGSTLVLVDLGARLIFPPPTAAALVVLTWVAVTGAFHLDGLIDTVDGLAASAVPEERLAAMRESTAGVLGALAGIAMVFGVFVAVLSTPGEVRWIALLLAPLAGRTTILLGYWRFPYGRAEQHLSRALKDGATALRAVVGTGIALVIAAVVGQAAGVVLLAASLAVGLALGAGGMRLLPGLSGDVHGAICEVTQLLVLLAAPATLGR
jgi:adenosylcobinamide-GDP ribazoletransferase